MFLCLRDYLYPTLTRESHFSRKTCHLEKRRRYNVWKSPKNVANNIASEASYVYIFSRQKLIKNAKNSQFGEFLKCWSLRSNSVTRQVIFIEEKLVKMPKLKTSNETFWVIFKHCEVEGASKDVSLFFESLEKHFRRRV